MSNLIICPVDTGKIRLVIVLKVFFRIERKAESLWQIKYVIISLRDPMTAVFNRRRGLLIMRGARRISLSNSNLTLSYYVRIVMFRASDFIRGRHWYVVALHISCYNSIKLYTLPAKPRVRWWRKTAQIYICTANLVRWLCFSDSCIYSISFDMCFYSMEFGFPNWAFSWRYMALFVMNDW